MPDVACLRTCVSGVASTLRRLEGDMDMAWMNGYGGALLPEAFQVGLSTLS